MKWNMDSVEPLADTIPALFISVFKRIVVHHIVIDIFCQCFIISGTSLTTSHNIIQHKGVMCDNFLHALNPSLIGTTLRHERNIHFYFPEAAGADVLWHFPMAPANAFKDWAKGRNWILYVEPKCDMLAKRLFQMDKQHEPASGAIVGAERPITLEERQSFQFGPEAAPRFNSQGESIRRQPRTQKGAAAWRAPSPPPPWQARRAPRQQHP